MDPMPSEECATPDHAGPASRSIGAYVAYLKDERSRGLPRGAAARLLRRASTPGLRDAARLHATALLAPIIGRRTRAIAARHADLRLHLGSGDNKLPGWVNIDLLGTGSDLPWDLRRRLPFPDGSAQAAFLEHVIEHFTLARALELLKDCHRVLAVGGVVRVGVPDLGRYIRSYTGDRELIEQARPNRPTPLLAVAEVAQFHGHLSAYDGETLVMLLEEAGFVDVGVRGFGESKALDTVPDLEERRLESIYAEGTRA
jgi:predicted SAM-dependent methyltransferase